MKGSSTLNATVVIPTLNEKQNLEVLLPRLSEFRVIIVDDGSIDGTQELCGEFENVKLIERGKKLGLVSAVIDGMKEMSRSSEYAVVSDADLSHEPSYIAPMLTEARRKEADLIIGSRYIRGGKSHDKFLRRLISRGANLLFKASFSRGVMDATSGFRVYSRRAVDFIIDSDEEDPIDNSYAGQIDILQRIIGSQLKVAEFPISFTPRENGTSKLGVKDIRDFANLARKKGGAKRYYWVSFSGLVFNQVLTVTGISAGIITQSFFSIGLVAVFGSTIGRYRNSNDFESSAGSYSSGYSLLRYVSSLASAVGVEILAFTGLMVSGFGASVANLAGIAVGLFFTYMFTPVRA